MATTYIYSKSGDFSTGEVIAGQLFSEIEDDGSIAETLVRVTETVGDDVEIVFEAALDEGDETTLDGLVAAHIPTKDLNYSIEGEFMIESSASSDPAVTIQATDASGRVLVEAPTVDVGTGGASKTVTIGTITGTTKLVERWGTGGHLELQPAQTGMADADANVTMSQLHTCILTMTPSTPRTLTLPDASDVVADYTGTAVSDGFNFSVINQSAADSITMAMGTGGTLIGESSTAGRSSSNWRLRVTNIGGGTEAYTVFRL